MDDWLFRYGMVACADLKHKDILHENADIISECGKAAEDKKPFKPKYVYTLDWWVFFAIE